MLLKLKWKGMWWKNGWKKSWPLMMMMVITSHVWKIIQNGQASGKKSLHALCLIISKDFSRKYKLTYCKMLGSWPPSLSLPQPATMPISPENKVWIFAPNHQLILINYLWVDHHSLGDKLEWYSHENPLYALISTELSRIHTWKNCILDGQFFQLFCAQHEHEVQMLKKNPIHQCAHESCSKSSWNKWKVAENWDTPRQHTVG